MKLNILFETPQILVIDKPAGLVVDPSITQKGPTLADILQSDFRINLERGGIVHRLDKDTSGVLVVAKTRKALENLQKQFKERKVKKEYVALVHGHLEKREVVNKPIGRNPRNREKFAVLEEGKPAVTEFIPQKLLVISSQLMEEIFHDFSKIQFKKLSTMNYQLYTLIACRPLTGRTHQIRVHLKYIGNPLVGDAKYAGRKISRLDRRWCPRQFLHAASLKLRHPQTGEWVEFKSPLPGDLEEALSKLKVQS